MPVLLSAYFFVFRWSGRFFTTLDDFIAVIVCSLTGTILIGVQAQRFWFRVASIMFHIAVSIALFGFWRLLSHPVLNDIF